MKDLTLSLETDEGEALVTVSVKTSDIIKVSGGWQFITPDVQEIYLKRIGARRCD
jgi:hypothetical protein